MIQQASHSLANWLGHAPHLGLVLYLLPLVASVVTGAVILVSIQVAIDRARERRKWQMALHQARIERLFRS
jgi:1,2-phenylacetyl-CoA epoxidase catalytic subunit